MVIIVFVWFSKLFGKSTDDRRGECKCKCERNGAKIELLAILLYD